MPADVSARFVSDLARVFKSERRALAVVGALRELQVPLPQGGREYFVAAEGLVIFSNLTGTAIRIEKPDHKCEDRLDRINDSQRVLAPLGTASLGFAVIEIVPGYIAEHDPEKSKALQKHLREKEDIEYWDEGVRNTGMLPYYTAEEPDGFAVVGDRLAVRRLRESGVQEGPDVQGMLYGKLRRLFHAGDRGAFWQEALRAKEAGTLIAGWNGAPDSKETQRVRESAMFYERNERKFRGRGPSSAGPAGP